MPQETESSTTTTLKTVWWAFGRGFCRVLFVEAPQAWRGPDRQAYRSEREVILRHLQPISLGIFVTVFSFISFRISANRGWNAIREKSMREAFAWDIKSTTTTTTTTTARRATGTNHFDRATSHQKDAFAEISKAPFDLFLSALLGSATFLLLHDDSVKAHDDLVRIPLLPGQSLVHSCVCPEVVPALRTWYHYASAQNGKSNQHPNEDAKRFFALLAQNCEARSRYLQGRREKGLAHPNLVPYPGLKDPAVSPTSTKR